MVIIPSGPPPEAPGALQGLPVAPRVRTASSATTLMMRAHKAGLHDDEAGCHRGMLGQRGRNGSAQEACRFETPNGWNSSWVMPGTPTRRCSDLAREQAGEYRCSPRWSGVPVWLRTQALSGLLRYPDVVSLAIVLA